MVRLFCDKKKGFVIKDVTKPVIIRDKRGVLFYSTEPLLPRIKEFNLPGVDSLGLLGEYFVDSGLFSPKPEPIEYKMIKLPTRERDWGSPKDFKITFGSNPNKCTVSYRLKHIHFDNSFLEKPLPELYFVLNHEYAHRFYHTEKYCDAMATNYMLKMGFNPEQIGKAHIDSLSAAQFARKEFNINKILELNAR